MQLCILKVCITYCIQFTINAHRYRISFSSYSCFNLSTIICCRARHTHATHLLQPTLPPLQSSICSKAIWSSNSMSIYLLDCFSARLSTPHIWPKMDMPIQYRFGRWIYNAIYIKDASTYLGILIQALVPYCPGSVIIPSHSDIIWPCNSL